MIFAFIKQIILSVDLSTAFMESDLREVNLVIFMHMWNRQIMGQPNNYILALMPYPLTRQKHSCCSPYLCIPQDSARPIYSFYGQNREWGVNSFLAFNSVILLHLSLYFLSENNCCLRYRLIIFADFSFIYTFKPRLGFNFIVPLMC